jgi:hypothetical protein
MKKHAFKIFNFIILSIIFNSCATSSGNWNNSERKRGIASTSRDHSNFNQLTREFRQERTELIYTIPVYFGSF